MGVNRTVTDRIREEKKRKNAYVLAHNYQLPEIQDVADYVGDSLGLARKAAELENETVVMCGVYFMAETAAVLNPEKKVLIPDPAAGCPLASFADAGMVARWRSRYPDHAFVAYVNTTAEVKAAVDICCTSSNAVQVVRSLAENRVVFLPDKNLGDYVRRLVPEKEIVLWPGFCVVHERADPDAIRTAREQHPGARVIIHPECPADILRMADAVCSTGGMFEDVASHPEARTVIVVTEWGILHALRERFPDRSFVEPVRRRMECRNMKKINARKLLKCLETERVRVTVDPEVARKARRSIERMLSVGTNGPDR